METTTTIENKITYRSYEKGDEEGILRLWEKESGWGAITMQQFHDWFLQTPYGECLVVVAVDEENTVKGQIIYAPSRVVVDGSMLKALRAAAPILDSSLRTVNLRSSEHPAYLLINKGREMAKEKGYQLIYTFPSFGWVRVMQVISQWMPRNSEIKTYDCFSVSLEDPEVSISNSGYHVVQIGKYNEEHESLWNDTLQQLPIHCSMARERDWLNRLTGGSIILETRSASDNRLIGTMTVKKDGLMLDLVARTTDDLKLVFKESVATLSKYVQENNLPLKKLKGMITKETESILNDFPNEKDSYRFAFGCFLIDDHFDFETIKTSRWYMTPLG